MKKFILILLIFGSCIYVKAYDKIDLNIEVEQSFYHSYNNLFNRMYGNTYPTFIGISFSFKEKNIKILSGLRYYRKSGETIIIPSNLQISPDKLKLTNFSIPLHLYYRTKYKKLKPFVLGGFVFTTLKEEWEDISIVHKHNRIGYELGAGAEFYSRTNWLLSAGLIYSFFDLKSTNVYLESKSLNGLSLFIHFTYKIM